MEEVRFIVRCSIWRVYYTTDDGLLIANMDSWVAVQYCDGFIVTAIEV